MSTTSEDLAEEILSRNLGGSMAPALAQMVVDSVWLADHDRAVAAAAFDRAVTAIDIACNANHLGMVEDPYLNALVADERTEK